MATSKGLKDDAARRDAILAHDRTLLVEAGAGSGKTAVMAGRIACLLANGVAPRSIAAVTFTELAASELLQRVRDLVAELCKGKIAKELEVALPKGLTGDQQANLAAANKTLDEITCSTIHGFCQRLIKPYPAEANIDPGASLMDRDEAELTFADMLDGWVRERLSGEQGGVFPELVLHDAEGAVALMRTVADQLRRNRALNAPAGADPAQCVAAYRKAAKAFATFLKDAQVDEPDATEKAGLFTVMADALAAIDLQTPQGLIAALTMRPEPGLVTGGQKFAAYRTKGKWKDAAKVAGLSAADGDRLFDKALECYAACCETWATIAAAAAGRIVAELIKEAKPVVARFRDHKRASAQLDFDDLIFGARDLLRDHDEVRKALGRRYRHVLVDEFQDTDPLQTEIFWRLCGDPSKGSTDWRAFVLRPGALFLVGDPKQAIYRFRGADVSAYTDARSAIRHCDPHSLLSISTNFRSRASILAYVNARFADALSIERGQPGFTALDAHRSDEKGALTVVALDVACAGDEGKGNAAQQRDAEADQVAAFCAGMIDAWPVADRHDGATRACRPGDIALLAPSGSELWRYEEALERLGVPVATQAGKGLFRRQEVQDLIAVTRVLADARDTLAFGALMRGPLVGLSEEELLDIVHELPPDPGDPTRIPRFDVNVEAERIKHPLARATLEKLQALRKRINATTPHALLSEAVDVLRVRPILLDRHRGQAERALANVDLYLSFASGYAVRGLRAFSEAMTASWSDETRAVEGRPDAQEDAVSLITMHSAKGLEWPIVVPINTMSRTMNRVDALTDRLTQTLHCKVFGVAPMGYDEARQAEQAELDRERVRLWYVAATRARELLVLPRLDVPAAKSDWRALVDLDVGSLPAFDLGKLSRPKPGAARAVENNETRDDFAQSASEIMGRRRGLTWDAPSRSEQDWTAPALQREPSVWVAPLEEAVDEPAEVWAIQGGQARGRVLHKLFEETLTGETADDVASLAARAAELIRELGGEDHADPAVGLSSQELGACVARSLALPQIASLRHALQSEFSVYASRLSGNEETATYGVVDALTHTPAGAADVVVDWKSDVHPDEATLAHYRNQVSAYLAMSGAARGLIVLATSGLIVEVTRKAE